jgi:BASS family bile acid:Na+ symporter
MISLVGLLLDVGLRVTWREVHQAMRVSRLGWILVVNFITVPGLTVALVRTAGLPVETGTGMILLAAAPFAPVVPVFAKMARANLALAAGLTAFFPVISSFVAPWICRAGLVFAYGEEKLRFDVWTILLVLVSTITLPLLIGILVRRIHAGLARKLAHPMEIISQAAGAVSLAFVTVAEFGTIVAIGWRQFLLMALIFEISLLTGYSICGGDSSHRRVVALGTSNRNIALAILIAVASFPGSPAVGAVVGNGLVLILLGLLHVGWWRWRHASTHG